MAPESEQSRIERGIAECEEHAALCNKRRIEFTTFQFAWALASFCVWAWTSDWFFLGVFAFAFGAAVQAFISWTRLVRGWLDAARRWKEARSTLPQARD